MQNEKLLQGLRVLLVEDVKTNQVIACRLLDIWGANYTIAENGQESINALRDAIPPYDLVLMDVQMPVMDGIEATGHIRNDLHLQTPIIALTSNTDIGDREACIACGMNDYLAKPYNHVDLLLKIQTYISVKYRRENVLAPPLCPTK